MRKRISENRRRFLKQTSLGIAGLTFTSNSFNIFHSHPSPVPSVDQVTGAFAPVRYRPLAAKVGGISQNVVSLNGAWRIDPKPGKDVTTLPLDVSSWSNFQVPGQWAQQGYNVPQDLSVALAR